MAIFDTGAAAIANSRSNSRLSVSQVFSPAEYLVHLSTLPALMTYAYGGPGNVVLTKGTIVGFNPTVEVDYETGRNVFPITYANGSNNPIGVLQFNVYEKVKDRLAGNMPNLLTHEYIELPLIHGIEHVYLFGSSDDTLAERIVARDAFSVNSTLATNMKMKWGCFYTHDATEYSALKAGDFVKPDKFGKFIKWNPNKSILLEAVANITLTTPTVTTLIYTKEPIKAGTTVTVNGSKAGAAQAAITAAVVGSCVVQLTMDHTVAYTDITINYTSALSDPKEQIVGQVLAIEDVTGTVPRGWLDWVTPVVEQGERAGSDIRYGNPTATPDDTNGYTYDPNYKHTTIGDYRAPGPWKLYSGIPGLTDGVISGLGAGVLPGWDFDGSVGAIRIALRW